jgi:hypothetical protein
MARLSRRSHRSPWRVLREYRGAPMLPSRSRTMTSSGNFAHVALLLLVVCGIRRRIASRHGQTREGEDTNHTDAQ